MIKGYNQTSPSLEQDILKKIREIQNRQILLRKLGYGLLSLTSLAGIIMSVMYVIKAMTVSGAFEYIFLAFSDASSLSYWKELLLSIAESFPFFEFSVSLAVVGLFFWSIQRIGRVQNNLIKI